MVKKEIVDRAYAWMARHRTHVTKLIGNIDETGIEPSGSDALRPELWKDIHWRWLVKTYGWR